MADLIRRRDINISLCNLAAERLYNKCYIEQALPDCDAASAAKGYALAMGQVSGLVKVAPSVPLIFCTDCGRCEVREVEEGYAKYYCRKGGVFTEVQPDDFCSGAERIEEDG